MKVFLYNSSLITGCKGAITVHLIFASFEFYSAPAFESAATSWAESFSK